MTNIYDVIVYFIIFAVIFALLNDHSFLFQIEANSKVAAKFVRKSLQVQQDLAKKVKETLNVNIYVFDSSHYFDNATIQLVGDIRVLVRENKYAVLSKAAQYSFLTANTYQQYSASSLSVDNIGVYL